MTLDTTRKPPTGPLEELAPAMDRLLAKVRATDAEQVDLADAAGRVLAEPVVADRDNPPCDVSAMDGYALRLADLSADWLAVAGESSIGRQPAALPPNSVTRIFTGGPLPHGADAVVRREDTDEQPGRMRLRVPADTIAAGQNIRRRGENTSAGATLLDAGTTITPAVASALAAFGVARPTVYRPVHVGVLVTGDELVDPAGQPQPWQWRDSNGPALLAMLDRLPWVRPRVAGRVVDDAAGIEAALAGLLESCDAALLTGGVSMGDHDHVPDVVRAVGAEVAFHKLRIRPGKPVLGATTADGRPILGLPGNPVSVLVTARRLAVPALAKRAGLSQWSDNPSRVMLADPDDKTLALRWFRLVRHAGRGRVELVANRGSGDLVAAAQSHGFIEVPPGAPGPGPYDFYPWSAA